MSIEGFMLFTIGFFSIGVMLSILIQFMLFKNRIGFRRLLRKIKPSPKSTIIYRYE